MFKDPIEFEIGEVTRQGRNLQVTIKVVGQAYPRITVVRDPSGKLSTHVLLKEAQSLNYHESFRGFKRRDPYHYGKTLKELWDRLGHEDDTVERIIAAIQKAESRLEKAVRARDRERHMSLLRHQEGD